MSLTVGGLWVYVCIYCCPAVLICICSREDGSYWTSDSPIAVIIELSYEMANKSSYSTLLCPILFLERNKICLNQIMAEKTIYFIFISKVIIQYKINHTKIEHTSCSFILVGYISNSVSKWLKQYNEYYLCAFRPCFCVTDVRTD